MTGPGPRCPCGSGDEYDACCGRFHAGAIAAPTAQALMRSRFSAFARVDAGYLLRTWHPSTRPTMVDLDPAVRWTRLDILETVAGSPFDVTGVVSFRAHYRLDGEGRSMTERSNFVRERGQWFYIDAG